MATCEDRECRDGIYQKMGVYAKTGVIILGSCMGFLLLLVISNMSSIGECAKEESVEAAQKKQDERWGRIEHYMGSIDAKMGKFDRYIEKTEKRDEAQDKTDHDLDKRLNLLENRGR